MLNNKTPWTDGLYCFEEWITEHDLKHWCFGGDGDDGGDSDVAEMTEENQSQIDSFSTDAGPSGMEQMYDQEGLDFEEVEAAMQNAAVGFANAPDSTLGEFANTGIFTTESNDELGLNKGDVYGSAELAVEDASNISSQIANLIGITSHASLDPETGLFEETTGFNAGPALSVIGGLIGGPVGYGIGAMKGLMTGNLVAAAEPTGVLSKANSLSNVITGSPVIGPQYSGPGLQMHTPSNSISQGPGLFGPGGALHTPGGIIGAIGRQ